jgi:hypothetical protein
MGVGAARRLNAEVLGLVLPVLAGYQVRRRERVQMRWVVGWPRGGDAMGVP